MKIVYLVKPFAVIVLLRGYERWFDIGRHIYLYETMSFGFICCANYINSQNAYKIQRFQKGGQWKAFIRTLLGKLSYIPKYLQNPAPVVKVISVLFKVRHWNICKVMYMRIAVMMCLSRPYRLWMQLLFSFKRIVKDVVGKSHMDYAVAL